MCCNIDHSYIFQAKKNPSYSITDQLSGNESDPVDVPAAAATAATPAPAAGPVPAAGPGPAPAPSPPSGMYRTKMYSFNFRCQLCLLLTV